MEATGGAPCRRPRHARRQQRGRPWPRSAPLQERIEGSSDPPAVRLRTPRWWTWWPSSCDQQGRLDGTIACPRRLRRLAGDI